MRGCLKPVIYEHFGSKEGLYTQVVDFEFRILLDAINGALTEEAKPRVLVERAALAHLVNLAWNGLTGLKKDPELKSEG